MRSRIALALAAAWVVPACGGSDSSGGGPVSSYVAPSAVALGVFADRADVLMSATPDLAGTGFYAAGYVTAGFDHTAAKNVIVAKILNNGTLDAGFDGDGVVETALTTTGDTDSIDIALQSDGKILVSATIPTSLDLGVIRLNTNGTIDAGFAPGAPAGNGIRQLDLNGGASDGVRAIAVHPATDEIFLHGQQLADGLIPGTALPRTDTDFVVVKLTANGDLDTTFANGTGKHLLDINLANATPKAIKVMTDGTIVASGYTTALSSGAQPVVYKLTSAGARATFANNGLFHQFPLALQTEIYGFAVHGDYIVTGGYGRDSGTRNDWCSLRMSWNAIAGPPPIPAGTRDLAWGGTPNGVAIVNPSSDPAAGSNCRGAVALPDSKTLLHGSTTDGSRAVFCVLDASGFLDFDYGGVPQRSSFGGAGADAFWGGAANATTALVAGWSAASGAASLTNNHDSFFMVIPVQ